jgi:hypothetical protein
MSTTITRYSDNASITPATVLPWTESVDFGTILHDIPGRPSGMPDVTLRPARSVSGEMRLFFVTFEDAHAALELHRAASVFLVETDDMPWLPAAYVPVGTGRLEQDPAALAPWTFTLSWREVTL